MPPGAAFNSYVAASPAVPDTSSPSVTNVTVNGTCDDDVSMNKRAMILDRPAPTRGQNRVPHLTSEVRWL